MIIRARHRWNPNRLREPLQRHLLIVEGVITANMRGCRVRDHPPAKPAQDYSYLVLKVNSVRLFREVYLPPSH